MSNQLSQKKIVVIGASGFIGKALVKALQKERADLTVVGRDVRRLEQTFPGAKALSWNGQDENGWSQSIDGAYAVINLAGESIAERWSPAKKKAVIESRVHSCRAISRAVAAAKKKPAMVLQASAIGIYGNRDAEVLDETANPGTGFLAEVGQQWEAAISLPRPTKLAIMRIGVVLGAGGGFLEKVVPLFKLFAGGHLGSGRQYISWIHLEDVIGAMLFLLKKQQGGIYNFTAPQPLAARDLFRELGQALRRPSWLHAPGFALKLLYGEMAGEVLLGGQKVLPVALQQAGYKFRYPEIQTALKSLL